MAPDRRGVEFIAILAIALVGLGIGTMAVAAQDLGGSGGSSGELTRGEPDIDAFLPEPELAAGTEESMEIQVQNEGNLRLGTNRDRVTNARGVTVEVVDEGPFNVKSGASGLGSLQEGQMATAAQRIEAPDDLEPGEYDITVEVDYSYTRQVSDGSGTTDERSGSERIDLTISVPDEARFAISDVDTDVEPGGDGPATVEIQNVGSETASQARATITGGGGVTIDGEAAEEVLGDLSPGSSETVTVDVDIAETTSEGNKPIEVAVTYRDSSGIEREARPETASLSPAPEQTFSISDLSDTLSVGYDGEVAGSITNDGPRAVDDAVLVVEPMSESLYVEDTRYALPELKAGETTAFRYPMDVSGQADPGPRQLRFTVEYTSGDRSTLEDGPISERVVIDDRQNEFDLETVAATVEQGSSSDFVLEITNERPETLSNIDAMLYTDSPLETTNDKAFVPELGPGESAEIAFNIVASDGASTETHPVELDFQYETERGETVVSDTYQHPVEVTASEEESDGGVLGSLVWGMAILTIAGLGLTLWWRKR
ncbi:COG1361 S-layer family protein [Natrialbaceae archaeon A-arb3/5]